MNTPQPHPSAGECLSPLVGGGIRNYGRGKPDASSGNTDAGRIGSAFWINEVSLSIRLITNGGGGSFISLMMVSSCAWRSLRSISFLG